MHDVAGYFASEQDSVGDDMDDLLRRCGVERNDTVLLSPLDQATSPKASAGDGVSDIVIDAVAQHEYDTTPELQELLRVAAATERVAGHRERREEVDRDGGANDAGVDAAPR